MTSDGAILITFALSAMCICYNICMKKESIIYIATVVFIVGAGVGYYLGNAVGFSNGKTAADMQLSGIVNLVFPKPPQEIHSIAGAIKGISGATLTLEVNDPEDYLPHVDEVRQKKITRYASLMGTTKILSIDFTKIDSKGNPRTIELKPSDLKIGYNVMVQSGQNIRTESKFDVIQIEIVK